MCVTGIQLLNSKDEKNGNVIKYRIPYVKNQM